jgi:hypothetical protein
MTHLFLVLSLVLYVNGGAEFFTSANYYVDQKACDEFALMWAEEKHDEDGVKEVYSQCVEAPGLSI